MMYLQIAIGFMLLLGGAEFLVRGAVSMARRLGISPLVIGMVVVGFGTSAPELVVTLDAAMSGATGIAVGNIVGSNIANILLILGASGLLIPIVSDPALIRRDGIILAGATTLFVILCLFGVIGIVEGAILTILLFAFLGYSFWRERANKDPAAQAHIHEAEEVETITDSLWLSALVTLGGLGCVVFGADQLVEGGTTLARSLGVADEVIGLTMIAVGTSLPELATAIVAAYRRHADVVLGNVLGSNIFNMMGVIGPVALITPLPVPDQILRFDLWVMEASTLALLILLATRRSFGRVVAGSFVSLYLAYIVVQFYGVAPILDALFG
ncbi:MAG: calcium/sodium antiporter [Rhodospirillales bacterium]|nr:calcium/sodium antiporter [Rhodospirillales bacterium]MCW8952877.1 calcium/sodium antiporter [Rhodospirillales bacterium]